MSDFTNLDGAVQNPVTEVEQPKTKKAMPSFVKEFMEEYHANEEIQDRMNLWSDAIEVINTCGTGEDGTLIQVDKGTRVEDPVTGKKKTENRVLNTTSAICGYVFKNVSEDIVVPYTTEEWFIENDQIVSRVVTGELKPGETVMLNKKWTTLFASQLEISNKFKNARLCIQGTNKKSYEDLLESAYITLTNGKSVHHDDIKIPVDNRIGEVKKGNKVEGIYVVEDPTMFKTFGYLNIKKEKAPSTTSRADIKGDLKGAAYADYVRKLRMAQGK